MCVTEIIYHPDTIFKDVRIPGYFSEPKGAREKKNFGKHWPKEMARRR